MKDGTFIDPATIDEDTNDYEFDMNIVSRSDYVDQMHTFIKQYIRRATIHQYEGDHSEQPGIRGEFKIGGVVVFPQGRRKSVPIFDDDDENNIVKRADMQSEIGQEKDGNA